MIRLEFWAFCLEGCKAKALSYTADIVLIHVPHAGNNVDIGSNSLVF